MIDSAEVLIVDDSVTDAELTIHALRIDGASPQVIWLSDAEEALSYMLRGRVFSGGEIALPRLVLLEVDMPGIGGIRALERLKRDARTNVVPIVMLSSQQDSAVARRCFALGANSYVVKPVEPLDYFREIAEIAHYWLALNFDFTEDVFHITARRTDAPQTLREA